MFTVYTEIFDGDRRERWYYGTYPTLDKANEVAYELGNEYPIFHCVCKKEEAQELGIQNLPH